MYVCAEYGLHALCNQYYHFHIYRCVCLTFGVLNLLLTWFIFFSSPATGHLLVTWWPPCSTPWSPSPPCCCCSSSSSLSSRCLACSFLGASSTLMKLWPKEARLITSPRPCSLCSRWLFGFIYFIWIGFARIVIQVFDSVSAITGPRRLELNMHFSNN